MGTISDHNAGRDVQNKPILVKKEVDLINGGLKYQVKRSPGVNIRTATRSFGQKNLYWQLFLIQLVQTLSFWSDRTITLFRVPNCVNHTVTSVLYLYVLWFFQS